jgi:hypothetical protein
VLLSGCALRVATDRRCYPAGGTVQLSVRNPNAFRLPFAPQIPVLERRVGDGWQGQPRDPLDGGVPLVMRHLPSLAVQRRSFRLHASTPAGEYRFKVFEGEQARYSPPIQVSTSCL